jgi:hypothetical protein
MVRMTERSNCKCFHGLCQSSGIWEGVQSSRDLLTFRSNILPLFSGFHLFVSSFLLVSWLNLRTSVSFFLQEFP